MERYRVAPSLLRTYREIYFLFSLHMYLRFIIMLCVWVGSLSLSFFFFSSSLQFWLLQQISFVSFHFILFVLIFYSKYLSFYECERVALRCEAIHEGWRERCLDIFVVWYLLCFVEYAKYIHKRQQSASISTTIYLVLFNMMLYLEELFHTHTLVHSRRWRRRQCIFYGLITRRFT